jgi:GMP synthase (glutamine-hydrolysing)
MPTAVAIRHVPFEDLGSFAGVLSRRGFELSYADAPAMGQGQLTQLDPDLLIVLGGPIGVYEHEAYPFLSEELDLLERRLAADRPTLGICLGCQLMARALGARVYPASAKELGWAPLVLTEAGAASPLSHIDPEQASVLHWHGDTFDLPAGTTLLASTDGCPNQAFSRGPRQLALQFHPEVTARGLAQWFVGHACEIAATPGVSVAQLRADTARWAPVLARRGPGVLASWLDGLD